MADLQVDSMSDAELLTKLAEHGLPIMAIKAPTRKVLEKKLKLVLSKKEKTRNTMDSKGDAGRFAGPSKVSQVDQLDSMSDADIQAKLLEHGLPIMPITATTRGLYIKQLKGILEKGNSKSRRSVDSKVESRHSLKRYSSGEKSDLETKEKRGRRPTTGGAMLPKVVNKTRVTFTVEEITNASPTSKTQA